MLVLAMHDEIVGECGEADAQRVGVWLERAMKDGMEEALAGPDAGGPAVPIGVEVESGRPGPGRPAQAGKRTPTSPLEAL